MTKTVDISSSTIFATLIIVGGFIFLWSIRDVLVLVVLAVILASALHPAIGWVEKRGIPRPAGVISIYVLVLGALTVIAVTFVPVIILELQQVVVTIARLAIQVTSGTGSQSTVAQAIASGFSKFAVMLGENAVRGLTFITSGGFVTLILALLIYYLTVDHGSFRRFLAGLVPMRLRPDVVEAGNRIERRLSLWLRGQLTLGLIVGTLVGIGLAILHVKYALVLALIAGLTELIPMVGPYIGMLPAAAVGFSMSPLTGMLAVLLYIVVQQMENNFITPRVVSQAVGIKPVIVFLALLIGAHLLNVIGIILAVPAVIIGQELVTLWQQQRSERRGELKHA